MELKVLKLVAIIRLYTRIHYMELKGQEVPYLLQHLESLNPLHGVESYLGVRPSYLNIFHLNPLHGVERLLSTT